MKAHRIFSFSQEKINSNGKYYSSLISLWQCYHYHFYNDEPYFMMEISEISQPKIIPLSRKRAISFVNGYSGIENDRIISSWFDKEVKK
jgi:hypothetical protein